MYIIVILLIVYCGCASSSYSGYSPTIPVPCVYHHKRTVCYCRSKNNRIFVDCSSKKLTEIPVIPFEFKSLSLKNNSLTHIDEEMLKAIRFKQNTTRLIFADNYIRKIEPGCFSEFNKLGFLDLSYNHLNGPALKAALFNLPKTIQSLSLAALRLDEFDDKLFESLKHTQLQQLDMQYNKFDYVHTKQLFKFLPNLRVLNFSNNYIKDFNFTASNSLLMLRLTRNDITEIPSFCNGNTPLFPNLKRLYLDKNCIFRIIPENINCLKNLESLNISQTNMHFLKDNIFSELESLKLVSLEYSSSLDYIHPLAFKSKSLERIYIRNNGLYFQQPYLIPETLFANTPNLTHLDISGNILGKMSYSQWRKMLKSTPHLVYLDISEAELNFLPYAVPNHLRQLHDFRAGFNNIKSINGKYFKPLTNLTKLYLNGNKITHVYEDDLPKNLTVLNLSYNPFICDCKILWFLNYLREHKHIVRYYPEFYNCSSGMRLVDFNITVKSCLLTQVNSKIISATCVTLAIVVFLVSFIYRYRWHIRYMIHVLNFHRRKYFIVRGQTFLHDIYILCSESAMETSFIRENIVMKLETDGKKVFFPPRDDQPNKPKIAYTLEQMDRSKFILICITEAVAADHFCEMQINLAMERSIHDQECRNVVVVFEEISPVLVNVSISQLLKTNQDYLLWSEERGALFWQKLYDFL